MPSRINMGPDGGPYIAINENNGNIELEDNTGTTVAIWDDANSQWDFQNNPISNVDSLTSNSVNTGELVVGNNTLAADGDVILLKSIGGTEGFGEASTTSTTYTKVLESSGLIAPDSIADAKYAVRFSVACENTQGALTRIRPSVNDKFDNGATVSELEVETSRQSDGNKRLVKSKWIDFETLAGNLSKFWFNGVEMEVNGGTGQIDPRSTTIDLGVRL